MSPRTDQLGSISFKEQQSLHEKSEMDEIMKVFENMVKKSDQNVRAITKV